MRLIIILTLLIISCKNESHIVLTKYSDGQFDELELIRPITKDSVGIKRLYRNNGQLHCLGGYKNNKKDGLWRCYYPNGDIKWKAYYVGGLESGEVFCKFADSSWSIKTIINGIKQGSTTEYNYDTVTKSFYYIYGNYTDDLEQGIWIWKDLKGNLMKVRNFINGINTGYFADYYPNGNIKLRGIGYHKVDEDYIRYDDSLIHYNESINLLIDSIEIFNKGRLLRLIK